MIIVFDIALLLSNSILCIYFITAFNGYAFNIKKNKSLIPVIMVLFSLIAAYHYYFGNYVITNNVIFIFSIVYGLISAKKVNGIIPAIILETTIILANFVIYRAAILLFKDFETMMDANDALTWSIFELIQTIIVLTVLKSILFMFKPNKKSEWKGYLLSLFFSATCLFGIVKMLGLIVLDTPAEIKRQVFTISIVFAVVNLILYISLYEVQKLLTIKYEAQILKDLYNHEDEQIKETKRYLNEIRSIKHDMNHHFAVIKGMLNDKKIDSCITYINEVTSSSEEEKFFYSSGNRIVDYIVNDKLSKNHDLKTKVHGSLGNTSDIKETDLVCLIGNIIDNAIEGASISSEKEIDLCFMRQNLSRIIICKNTIDGSVLKNNPNLFSTKNDDSSHGYGTKIIKKIVHKYSGMLDFYEENNNFCVQVVIPEIQGL